jgi:hypothetical protein
MKYKSKKYCLRKGSVFTLFLLITLVIFGSEPTEEQQVISVVKQFFKVLETRDTDLARTILLQSGSNFSIREEGNKKILKHTGFGDVINSLKKNRSKYREMIFSPTILIHKDIAILWAKYRFYIDGKFSHCGVDSFSMIKIDNKWKIAGIIYTIEKKGCNN